MPGIMEKAKDKVIDAAEATKEKMEQVKDKVTGKQHERAQEEFFDQGIQDFGRDTRGPLDKTKDKTLEFAHRGAEKIENVADKAENKAFRSKECGPGCATENLHYSGNNATGNYTSTTHQHTTGPSF
ncbi:hypothetical protein DdX_12312 [Ditylenchus destructor]|uniref:Uncharacterized protein n=1 Tax=Ditylenchus destructor TaxID=166010 RepID=A0AAD4R3N1_9BILA|nr:hypothetical protein DdX_12312 [Ditylenchus destructor]